MLFFRKGLPHADLRQSSRHSLHYPACIEVGNGAAPLNCMIFDVSERGARLTVGTRTEIPEEFVLVFRRHCRVVRRSEGQVGVEFIAAP
jgi:hypothetical protein